MPEQLTEQMEGVRKQLQTRWRIEAEALNKSWFSSKGHFDTALAKLNSKYQQEEFKIFSEIQQQEESRQRVQELIAGPSERGRAEETDIRLELGPEAERLVFPEQRDLGLEHSKLLREKERLLRIKDPFVKGRDGKIYYAKVNKDDEYTNEPDKNKPISAYNIKLLMASTGALQQIRQEELGLVQSMGDQGIENPNKFQSLELENEAKHWLKRFASDYVGSPVKGWLGGLGSITGPGIQYRAIKSATKELTERYPGTFAQKVQETIYTKPGPGKGAPSRTQAKKKLTYTIAERYRLQYGSKEDARAAARADGYIE